MELSGQHDTPAASSPGNNRSTQWVEGSVGRTASLDGLEERITSFPCRNSKLWSCSALASHCAEGAIPAPDWKTYAKKFIPWERECLWRSKEGRNLWLIKSEIMSHRKEFLEAVVRFLAIHASAFLNTCFDGWEEIETNCEVSLSLICLHMTYLLRVGVWSRMNWERQISIQN